MNASNERIPAAGTSDAETRLRHLTVRGVPRDLADALQSEKERRGLSLNQTVKDLLRQSLGLNQEPCDNSLGRFASTWSDEEFLEFQRATRAFDETDEPLWK